MPILQIRDEDGNFIPIPAIKGDKGKSAYEQAKEGGYKGTEEEFIAILNGLLTFDECVRIKTGRYTGATETNKESVTLNFSFKPKFIIVADNSCTYRFEAIEGLEKVYYTEYGISDNNYYLHVTWGDDYVYWTSNVFNKDNTEYWYIAIG